MLTSPRLSAPTSSRCGTIRSLTRRYSSARLFLLSCSAAVLVATQFWHAYQGGLYMAWFLPLLILTIFRPNLEDRMALTAARDLRIFPRQGRWLSHVWRQATGRGRRPQWFAVRPQPGLYC